MSISKDNIFNVNSNIKIKAVDKPISKLVSFSIDFSALDNINNLKLPKFNNISKIKIKDQLNEKSYTSVSPNKQLDTLFQSNNNITNLSSNNITPINPANSIGGYREYKYMKDIELNVKKEKQSKSYNEHVVNPTQSKNLSTLKSRLNYKNQPSRTRTKPIIEFEKEHDQQKVMLDNVASPSRFVFRCKYCEKNIAANNVNQQQSCRLHTNCNSNVCKRCYDAAFIMNSKSVLDGQILNGDSSKINGVQCKLNGTNSMSARDIYKKNIEHQEKFRKQNIDLEKDSNAFSNHEIELLNNSGTVKFDDIKQSLDNTNKSSKFDVYNNTINSYYKEKEKSDKMFTDKEDEIKFLQRKVKMLEKKNKDQSDEINELKLKFKAYDPDQINEQMKKMQECFNTFKNNQHNQIDIHKV